MKTWLVRFPKASGDLREWMGNAESALEAAKYATVKGPFWIDCPDLLVFDHDGNPPQPISRDERLGPFQ